MKMTKAESVLKSWKIGKKFKKNGAFINQQRSCAILRKYKKTASHGYSVSPDPYPLIPPGTGPSCTGEAAAGPCKGRDEWRCRPCTCAKAAGCQNRKHRIWIYTAIDIRKIAERKAAILIAQGMCRWYLGWYKAS
jgi:hypothetical protein